MPDMAEQRNAAVSIDTSCALALGANKISRLMLSAASSEGNFLTYIMRSLLVFYRSN